MNRFAWLDAATRKIRFGPDREAVRRELAAHIEDLREVSGLDEKAAVEAMGDPDAVSEELGRLHSPWWGYLWWVSRVVLGLAVILAVWGLISCWDDVFWYSRPELPSGDTYTAHYGGAEWSVLKMWRPSGTKDLSGYRFRVPMAWLMQREYDYTEEDGETVHATPTYLMVCLRADTWRFWEPCSSDQYMVLANVASDSGGELYARTEILRGHRGLFCETWQEPFTTWYVVWLDLPGPENVPEWVDIPVGYGGGSVRVDLTEEVAS